MIGSLAQGLVGVIVDEVAAQGGRRIQQQRDGVAPYQQQQQHHHHQQQRQQPQQQLPPGPLASLVESMTLLFNRLVAALVAGLQYLLLFEALLLSAVVLYGALYWLVMPLRLHDKVIFFDYSNRATAGGATGTVDFLAQHTQWDPSPLTNVERLNTKVLQPGQHYKVGLELQMPTSYANRRVGVFMVHTTLLDDDDKELATSARPAMLPHTSALRKGVGMLFSWPLHVLGLRREAETVLVDCVDFYEENALHPLTKARVTVSSGRVQFYRSSIHITPQLKGLPWLMQHWFYSTLAAGVLFIASVELMLFGFCYVFFFLEAAGSGDPEDSKGGDGGRAVSLAGGINSSSSSSNNNNSSGRRSAGDARSYGDGGAARVSPHTGRLSSASTAGGGTVAVSSSGSTQPSAAAAAAAGAATTTGRGAFHEDDEGLRRRRAASASAAAPPPNRGDDAGATRGASSSASSSGLEGAAAAWATKTSQARTQPSSSLPPGVQAYQRGARYVVQAGGGGGRPAARADGGSGSSGAGTGARGRGGGGANDPWSESASREEMDAAAMASWAALDGNVADTRRGARRTTGERRLPGAAPVVGRGGGSQGVRVVECVPVAEECKPLPQPRGQGTAATCVEGEGAEVVESEGGDAARDRGVGNAGRGGLGSSPGSCDEDNW